MIAKRIDGSPADQLRLRRLCHQFNWSPWFDQGLRPTSDRHVRMRAFININSDLYQDNGGIIQGARGLNVNNHPGSPSPRATVLFFWTANLCPPPPPPRVSLKQLLRWNYEELSLQQPCKNFVEFRWRNLRRSPIYRSPVKSGRESGRV